jgi:tetratricopeptide (TPR) repeat protein
MTTDRRIPVYFLPSSQHLRMDTTLGYATTELAHGEVTAFAPLRRLQVGAVIANRYEIRQHLGTGGYGVVYLALDRTLETEVALKTLRPDRQSPAALARFRREVNVAHEISGPNLVRVFDIGSDGELWYLTMEVVRGGSLRDRLRDGPLPVREAIVIATGILDGLGELHAKGAIHRDLKPENILLSPNGEPKLADFGLARFLDEERARNATATSAIVGTSNYMAPEQALNRAVDPRSDLYALGIVLFQMLTGQLPFAKAQNVVGALSSQIRQSAPDVRTLRRDVPLWVALVISRLLAFEPARRYASAVRVARVLRRERVDVPSLLTPARVVGSAMLVLFIVTAIVLATPRKSMRFARLSEFGEDGVEAVSTKGEVLWHLDHVQRSIAAHYALARLGRGARPVIATVLLRPHDFTPPNRQLLSFLDPDTGRVLRQTLLPSGAEHFTRWPDHYFTSSLNAVDLNNDGVDEIVVSYQQIPESGTYIVLYEPRSDRARIVFLGMGGYRYSGAEDVDGDGRRDMIILGIDNGVNWYNAFAAVRIDPWIDDTRSAPAAPIAFSPDMANLNEADLIWYLFLPRGWVAEVASALRWDPIRSRVTIPYSNRPPAVVTYDGFLAGDRSSIPPRERDAFRRTAWRHYCESARILAAGLNAAALRESESAVAAAKSSSDSILLEVMQVALAKTLVATGRRDEGEAMFRQLAGGSENASEIAYDAGRAFYLHGEIDRAVGWYVRGIGAGGGVGDGKSKHEYIQAIVFALAEQRAWNEAIGHIDRFRAAYVTGPYDWVAMYREFVRWRAGGTPQAEAIRVSDFTTDLGHYWLLEFRNAHQEDARELLRLTQQQIDIHAETRAALWSLKAELLARLGRNNEAAVAARQAWEVGQADAKWNIIARGHLPLIQERLSRFGPRGR